MSFDFYTETHIKSHFYGAGEKYCVCQLATVLLISIHLKCQRKGSSKSKAQS